jgi:hypothetical protein
MFSIFITLILIASLFIPVVKERRSKPLLKNQKGDNEKLNVV